jgi:hypothetical protein
MNELFETLQRFLGFDVEPVSLEKIWNETRPADAHDEGMQLYMKEVSAHSRRKSKANEERPRFNYGATNITTHSKTSDLSMATSFTKSRLSRQRRSFSGMCGATNSLRS